jgi:RNA polymerase sigma-70 factor (ECF subfamily)
MDRFALTISSPTVHLRLRRSPKVGDATKQGTAETDPLSRADTDATFPSSEELLRRVGTGDREARELLGDRFVEQVFTIASKILRNRKDAEDVTRIVFSEIFREARLFDPNQESAEAAFRRYTYHRCCARLHWSDSRSLNLRFMAPTKTEQADPPFSGTARDGLNVRQRADIMAQAMRALTDVERKVVTLMYFQGLSDAEVAEQLNLEVADVAKLYYRGVKQLLQEVSSRADKTEGGPSN